MESDSNQEGRADGQEGAPPDARASTTVGTGSMLGLGCVVVVIVLVLVALAMRQFAGGW